MKPYYDDGRGIVIYCGDCREIVPTLGKFDLLLTDPPFNVGYHYESYADNLDDAQYYVWLSGILGTEFVVIHYPESIFNLASTNGLRPKKCASWVYNANTHRQWRMIAWFGIKPDFSLGEQPYQNISDKRIKERIARGESARLYDWWFEQQVKNISEDKTDHPCQMPLSIMKNIISVTPCHTILDPFAGSGTTGRAAKDLGRKCTMIEREEKYCEIAARRMEQEVFAL